MIPYRTPDPAAEIARLTRECERRRGELAAPTSRRGRMGLVDHLAAGAIIGGPAIVAIVLIIGPRITSPWAVWGALVAFGAWWAWALAWARSAR